MSRHTESTEVWRTSITLSVDQLQNQQHMLGTSPNKVSEQVVRIDENQRMIFPLLKHICIEMGVQLSPNNPEPLYLIDVNMTTVVEKRIRVTPGEISIKKNCQNRYLYQEIGSPQGEYKSPPIKEAGKG